MATNNTSEASHERDEELKKFIENQLKDVDWYIYDGLPPIGEESTIEICKEVAAFASKRAFQEGRLAGLKEMDEAHNNLAMIGNPMEEVWNDRAKLSRLRAEYQQPN